MATGGKHIDIGPHESLVTTAIMAICYKEAGAEHLLVIIEYLAVRIYLFILTNDFRDIFEVFNGIKTPL